MRSATLAALAALLIAAPGAAQLDTDALGAAVRPEVERLLLAGSIPSATVAIVVGDEVVWKDGFGYANLWARTPAVPSTVYLIGSTFKAQATVGLLQQMERGRFELDDAVRDYIDFPIRGEDAARPVTFRHLLTHTSGMPVTFGAHRVWGETVPLPLETYLADSLKVVSPPMDSVRYSNLAYSLVGWLVQDLSGVPFKEYVRQHVWGPLEMTSTAFEPTPEMEERLAIPYVLDEDTRRPVAAVRLKANVWPAGITYGTVEDQANWLIMNLNGGVFEGRRLIDAATLAQMHTLQFPQLVEGDDAWGYGLTWRVAERRGEKVFAHTGSVAGYTAILMGNLDHRIGVAVLTNGNRAHPHLYAFADRVLEIVKDRMATRAAGN